MNLTPLQHVNLEQCGIAGDIDVIDGVDGWELVSFGWDATSGIATLDYERRVEGAFEEARVLRTQPHDRAHVGWGMHWRNRN